MFDKDLQKGFIALTTTIVIASVLLVLMVSLARDSYFGRFAILGGETKEISKAMAESCAETAKLKYAQQEEGYYENPSVFPDISTTTINGVEYACTIKSLDRYTDSDGDHMLAQVYADFYGVRTNLEVEFNPFSSEGNTDYNYVVTDWEEVNSH